MKNIKELVLDYYGTENNNNFVFKNLTCTDELIYVKNFSNGELELNVLCGVDTGDLSETIFSFFKEGVTLDFITSKYPNEKIGIEKVLFDFGGIDMVISKWNATPDLFNKQIMEGFRTLISNRKAKMLLYN